MSIFLKMVLRGLKRRKREMRYVSLVTFIAVLFMSSVNLFQNVMDRYLMETNYQNYGDWVFSAVKDYQDSGVIFSEISHPYLAASGICQTGETLLNGKNEPGSVNLGTVDASVREFGNITLYEGKFPEEKDEIAMDLSSLSELGYSYDLGQTIRVAVQKEDGILEKEFHLVGTLKSFAENWKHAEGYFLPNGIVTEEGMHEVCEPLYATYFYQLDRKYENIDMEEFAAAFMTPGFMRTYNSYVYENRVWGSRAMFQAAEIILIFIGALAVGYLMLSYISQRRKWYYQLRCTGADKMQIRMIILTETVYGTFPYALAGMMLPYLAGAVICYGASVNLKVPYFFKFQPEQFFRQFGAILGVLLFSMVCAWFGSRDKRLGRNKEEVTKRQIKRLRRDAKKERNVGKRFLRRQRMMHPLQRAASILFSIVVCFILILCLNRMYQAKTVYEANKEWYGYDFKAGKTKEMEIRYGDGGDISYGKEDSYDMYDGVSTQIKEEVQSLIGIEYMDWQIHDVTHILQWEKKEDSPVERMKKKDYENHAVSVEKTYFQYYEDCESILKELKKKYGPELKQLDEKAFQNGEQIILFLPDYESILTGEKAHETTIQPGDTVEIVSAEKELNIPVEWAGYDLPGITQVKVGAVIEDVRIEDSALFAYVFNQGILASRNLAERVAQADGQEAGANRICLKLNKNQSFESTQKRLVSIFKKNGMSYVTYAEEMQQARNAYIRNNCIYGIMFCTVLSIFLILQIHFHQIQNQYRERKYRLLKQLGMTHSFFRTMTVKDGLGQWLWMLFSIPLSYGVMAYLYYLEARKEYLEGVISWSDTLGDWTGLPYWRTLDRLYEYTNMGYTIVLAVFLILVMVWIGYLSARRYEKAAWNQRNEQTGNRRKQYE